MIKKAGRRLKKRENRISVIFFIITIAIAICPLISRYCINGHDLEYHLLRIESLKEGILMGKPFLKVNALFFGGSGYASSMFYSDFFMYFPALLRVIGFGIGTSYHIFAITVFVACYLTTYYSVYRMSYSKYAATIAAVLMTLCPYHMDDMLIRGAVGEYLAFIFVPLVVYGVYNVIFEDMDNPAVFAAGFAGLILTHPATCILCVVFALAAFVLYIKKLIKNPGVLIRLLLITLITALITSFFWLPMLEQFASAKFYVSQNWSDLLDASLDLYKVFTNEFPGLGFILAALILPRFTLRRKDYPILEYVDFLIVMTFIFTLGTTNLIPWERIGRFFTFLQFPWRMLVMSSTLLAIADAIVIKIFLEKFSEIKRELIFDAALIVIVALCSQIALNRFNENSQGYYDYADDYYSYAPFTSSVIAGEWLPLTVTDAPSLVEQSTVMMFDDGSRCDFTRERATVFADITESHEYVDVPFVYYKGYKAYLTDTSGKVTNPDVTGEGENGLCRVYLNGQTGSLKALYKSTVLQIISYIVSAITIVLLIFLWYFNERNKRKLKLNAEKAGAVISALSVFVILPVLFFFLTGCATVNFQKEENRETYDLFSDPEDMVDYLKSRGEEKEELENSQKEEEENSLVCLNICSKGYIENGKGFGVQIDESTGEQIISVPNQKAVKDSGIKGYMEVENLYGTLLSNEIEMIKVSDIDMPSKIMNEADLLLCLEVFPENENSEAIGKAALRFANELVKLEREKLSTLDKYMKAAVLAKASYVLEGWGNKSNAEQIAKTSFEEAEENLSEEDQLSAARVFAAAELYRLTGMVTYKSVVDATVMDVIPEGFSYEEPGFYGLFTYLNSENQGTYKVSGNMMEYIFEKANDAVKDNFEQQIISIRIDDSLFEKEEAQVRETVDNARLVAMADYISECVEYETYMEKVLCYIGGANLTGKDYTQQGESLCNEPLYFLYDSLANDK